MATSTLPDYRIHINFQNIYHLFDTTDHNWTTEVQVTLEYQKIENILEVTLPKSP